MAWRKARGRGASQAGGRAIVESARSRRGAGGGKRTTGARDATHLALRDVLHVRGEGAEHPFGVRALIRVVAVVQDVAQLLELGQGLRHGAAPAGISTRARKTSSRVDACSSAYPTTRPPSRGRARSPRCRERSAPPLARAPLCQGRRRTRGSSLIGGEAPSQQQGLDFRSRVVGDSAPRARARRTNGACSAPRSSTHPRPGALPPPRATASRGHFAPRGPSRRLGHVRARRGADRPSPRARAVGPVVR